MLRLKGFFLYLLSLFSLFFTRTRISINFVTNAHDDARVEMLHVTPRCKIPVKILSFATQKKKKRKNKNLINLITKVSFTVNIVNQDSIWTKRQVLCKPQEFN